MKKQLFGILVFLLILVSSFAAAEVVIDEAHFPDQNFRKLVLEKIDLDGNGVLNDAEIMAVEIIDCPRRAISSLVGIEFFPALKALDCSNGTGGGSSADNLRENNTLTMLDLSHNTQLTSLECYGNQLEEMILGKKEALTRIDCHENQLIYLDVSECPALRELYCFNNNLAILNLGEKANLTRLDCTGNKNLHELHVDGSPMLSLLACSGASLHELDVSVCSRLEYLDCSRNRIATLDLSHCPRLSQLDCSDNLLTRLDVSGNPLLESFGCSENSLTNLDISGNPSLTWVNCDYNNLAALTFGKNTLLKELNCSNNRLTELDAGRCPALMSLDCGSNLLHALDVSGNQDLRRLNCGNNALTALDLSMNIKLEECICCKNRLKSLDISRNKEMTVLEAYDNELTKLNISVFIQKWKDTRSVRRQETREGYHCFIRKSNSMYKMTETLLIDPYVRVTTTKQDDFGFGIMNEGLKTDVSAINITNNGFGQAYASPGIGELGSVITLSAEPDPGYRLEKWEVLSGDVTIRNNQFILGKQDAEILAVFTPVD